ncbi:hypothetical protein BMS3Bbin10_00762 [bacterium BMS3Bbin10]|nr:hypothetical protein BMS3Bbin10_00762 [bacterium BMS3Bbin10]
MTSTKGKKKRKLKEAASVEVHDDAWKRFESTVKDIVPGKPNAKKGKADAGGKPAPATQSSNQSD